MTDLLTSVFSGIVFSLTLKEYRLMCHFGFSMLFTGNCILFIKSVGGIRSCVNSPQCWIAYFQGVVAVFLSCFQCLHTSSRWAGGIVFMGHPSICVCVCPGRGILQPACCHGWIQPIMLGGAKPPILGQGRGPKAEAPGPRGWSSRGEGSQPHSH